MWPTFGYDAISHSRRRDFIAAPEPEDEAAKKGSSKVIWQVAAVIALFVIGGGAGYYARQAQLKNQAAATVSPTAPLGDLTPFRTIAEDMLQKVNAGDMSGAKTRADDLETAWDNSQARLRPMNEEKWTQMDGAIDDVLTKVRAGQPNPSVIKASLQSFISVMDNLGKQAATPQNQTSPTGTKSSNQPLGDLSAYRKIAEDMRRMVGAGDFSGAKTRARDLESEWDNAQTKLRPVNPDKWTEMDNAIDDVLRKVRSVQQNGAETSASLESLIAVINTLDNQK